MFKIISKYKTLCQITDTALVGSQYFNNNVLLKQNLNNKVVRCSHFSTNTNKEDMVNLESITKGDEHLQHKLKVIFLEAEVMRQEGRNVPSNSSIKRQHWEELLKLETRSARRKYFEFLFKIEKKKENEAAKKQQRKIERDERPFEPNIEGALRYDLGHNNILLRVYDGTINQLFNNKLMQAMQFGQQIVVDCGYHQHMTTRENINCAKQLMLLFSENRFHDDPYDVHFCNADKSSILIDALHRHIPTMYDNWFPFNLHEQSYLEMFPKKKLVYLTPHCREELVDYDHDAVYIIGGIVDKMNNEPVSLAKAKKEGLRMAKLPLDHYLQWGSGSGKSLTLNQVISILLDAKLTGDWHHALRHVPRRKLTDFSGRGRDQYQDERKYDKPIRSNYTNRTVKDNKSRDRMLKVRSIMYE